MRPIDADAIFPWYVEAFKGEIEPHDVRFSMHDIEMNLSNIPTIDAVPVIRCKDCKWCVELHDIDIDTIVPYLQCTNWNGTTDADGYCCAAVRKEE